MNSSQTSCELQHLADLSLLIGSHYVQLEIYFAFLFFAVCSTSSSTSTKYDPDLLRADVALARNRVERLKQELLQIRTEVKYTEQGVENLAE